MTQNVYQMVTDRIIEQMQQGRIPWQKSWGTAAGNAAISYVSRRPYSFLNQCLLGKTGEYLTWKQIQGLKGTVKKGAKSKFVVFFTFIPPKGKNLEEMSEIEKAVELIPLLRYYNVFHIDDCEGIKSKIIDTTESKVQPIETAEKIINDYLSRESTLQFINNEASSKAYYSPHEDKVVVPMISQFEHAEDYYATAFHEFTHSTIPTFRCDRKAENNQAFYGNEDYSREELVAEIGSAMICNRIGIETSKTFRNTIAYLQSWIKVLQNDNKMIVWASSRAEKAAKYIMNITS